MWLKGILFKIWYSEICEQYKKVFSLLPLSCMLSREKYKFKGDTIIHQNKAALFLCVQLTIQIFKKIASLNRIKISFSWQRKPLCTFQVTCNMIELTHWHSYWFWLCVFLVYRIVSERHPISTISRRKYQGTEGLRGLCECQTCS